jgi:hypothetical protein
MENISNPCASHSTRAMATKRRDHNTAKFKAVQGKHFVMVLLLGISMTVQAQTRPKVMNLGSGWDVGLGSYYPQHTHFESAEGSAFRIGLMYNIYSNRVPVYQNFVSANLQFGPGFSINYGYRFGISPLEGTLLRLKPYVELGPSLGLLIKKGEDENPDDDDTPPQLGINSNLGLGIGCKYFYNNVSALNFSLRLEAMGDLIDIEKWGSVQIMLCVALLNF